MYFKNPRIKKKDAWNRLAETMRNEYGHSVVTGDICDKKMRNLKLRYKGLKDNRKQTGRGKKVWEYFDQMDSLFFEDHAISIPNIIETNTVTSSSVSNVAISGSAVVTPESSNAADMNNDAQLITETAQLKKSDKPCKRKRSDSIDDYLKDVEERRLKVLVEIKDAIVRSNDDRMKVLNDLNDNIKELLSKF